LIAFYFAAKNKLVPYAVSPTTEDLILHKGSL
jgi:hypothetical protein